MHMHFFHNPPVHQILPYLLLHQAALAAAHTKEKPTSSLPFCATTAGRPSADQRRSPDSPPESDSGTPSRAVRPSPPPPARRCCLLCCRRTTTPPIALHCTIRPSSTSPANLLLLQRCRPTISSSPLLVGPSSLLLSSSTTARCCRSHTAAAHQIRPDLVRLRLDPRNAAACCCPTPLPQRRRETAATSHSRHLCSFFSTADDAARRFTPDPPGSGFLLRCRHDTSGPPNADAATGRTIRLQRIFFDAGRRICRSDAATDEQTPSASSSLTPATRSATPARCRLLSLLLAGPPDSPLLLLALPAKHSAVPRSHLPSSSPTVSRQIWFRSEFLLRHRCDPSGLPLPSVATLPISCQPANRRCSTSCRHVTAARCSRSE